MAGKILPTQYFLYSKEVVLYPFGEERYNNNVTHRLNAIYSGVLGYTTEDVKYAPLLSSQLVANVQAKSTAQLLKRMKDAKGNMAVATAEMNKTMNLVTSSATKIGKALFNIRKGNFREAAQDLGVTASRGAIRRARQGIGSTGSARDKAIAKSWLELQYGWKPLLQSVYDAAQQVADAEAPILRGIATGWAEGFDKAEVKRVFTQSGEPTTSFERRDCRYEYTQKCVYTVENSVAHRAAINGLSNPLSVAWELVPYSFVVDWFLPIGDYIDLLDATSGLKFKSGCKTSFEESRYLKDYEQKSLDHFRQTGSAVTRLRVERSKMTSFPSLNFPSFRLPQSMTKAANALALLQNFRK